MFSFRIGIVTTTKRVEDYETLHDMDYVVGTSQEHPDIDLALFAKPPAPSVFIEIKAPGSVENELIESELQNKKYDFDTSGLVTILTDGNQWAFYYSQEPEELSSKCFEKLDILHDTIDDLVASFDMFLSKNSIVNGKALTEAENILNQSMREQAVDDVLEKETLITGNLATTGSLEETVCNSTYFPDRVKLVLAIGYLNMSGRYNAFLRAKKQGYCFESLIHPKAFTEKNSTIGEGPG